MVSQTRKTARKIAAAAIVIVWLPFLLSPSIASAAIYTGTMSEASTLDELVNASDYSASTQGDVLRLYQAFFDRDPDIDGAKYWIDINSQGQTLDQIADYFTLSTEFANNYDGTSNNEYLVAVYTNVLGRDFDQAGFDYWLGFLDSGELTRGGVVRWITANAEFTRAYPFVANVDVSLGEWFTTLSDSVLPGQQTFDVSNDGQSTHELVIVRGESFDDLPKLENGAVNEGALGDDLLGRTEILSGGETTQIDFDLAPGSYVFLCNIGIHAPLGMETTVVIE